MSSHTMRSPNGATTILSGLSGPRPDAQRLEDTATRVIAHTESRWLSPTQHGVGPESIHEAVGTILARAGETGLRIDGHRLVPKAAHRFQRNWFHQLLAQ